MRAFLEIFRLEFAGLVRSKALALLTVASVVWMFLAPLVFRADGTQAGAREMCVRFSLGGVATLLAVALLITAAGSLSRERAAKRLQLTMVRPVRLFALVLAKIAALALAGALVLALAATIEALRQNPARTCSSVYRPVLPSPAEEAEQAFERFVNDPDTPPSVKKAKKSIVLRLLTQRALDRYDTLATNATATWRFAVPADDETSARALRLRFSNLYGMRDTVVGTIAGPGCHASVSNVSQAVITVPLEQIAARGDVSTGEIFLFANHGTRPVMLRPRKDVELLVASDGFLANLVRAYLQLVGVLTLLIAFGVFLGAGLSCPVAVFVAVVVLALSEMSPSVIEQYPDDLETDRLDAIGLSIVRFTAAATHPISSVAPLAALASDDRVEPAAVARTLLTDMILYPVLFALLAAVLLPRKQDEL